MRCSLWREDGSVVYNCCWPSLAQLFLGPSPVGLVTIFYCVRFETSLFVASYDSQDYGGGIRPHLHTLQAIFRVCYKSSARTTHRKHNLSTVAWRRPHRKQSFVYCCMLEHVYRAVAWQCATIIISSVQLKWLFFVQFLQTSTCNQDCYCATLDFLLMMEPRDNRHTSFSYQPL
jgi:hypothetical protein